MQGLDKRANGGRVGQFLILDDGAKNIVPKVIVPEVFFNSFPDLEYDVREHSLYSPSEIVAVKVSYREKNSSSLPNPCSRKVLYPL